MRPSIIIEKILEILQAQAEATADILNIMTSGYSGSRRKLYRSLRYGPPRFKIDWAETFRDKQKFYNLLNHLKNQGFIENKKRGAGSIWKITADGLKKLNLLKHRNLYSQTTARYGKGAGESTTKIVTYDIPTTAGDKKRFWLRWALKNLGFTMLQKSVWVGKKKIPEEFLSDLHERKMLPYVHILEVAKSGTLKEIT